MGAIIAGVGLAVAGAGMGLSAKGTAKNAKAIKKEAEKAQARENAFAGQWTTELDTLVGNKREQLADLGNIFNRMASSGAFGDTRTLDNLRKTQEDFSALAAGDFTGFESQLRSALNDQFIRSAGAPAGAYTQLGANTLMNLRLTGAQQASQTTQLLNDLSYQALGYEFGIMDQRFNTAYQIDRQRLDAINQLAGVAAATAGIKEQAVGQGWQQFGSLMTSYGLNLPGGSSQQIQSNPYDVASNFRTASQRPTDVYFSSTPTYTSGVRPTQQVTYNVDPRLPAYSNGYASAALLPPMSNPNMDAYNSLLAASNVANSLSNTPYAGGMFSALSSIGQQIAGGMTF